ncbi:MAG TPA: aldo/keto reductase [Candidatus Thermoplasmatota archaeon]|nr:aldo/keto reductase [Candidatus Thermoplasmatota archaeon]
MIRRPFGSTGIEVPIVGQGTWQIKDKKAAGDALRIGLDLGMTHVDTAELYRGSEEVIAPVIGGRREEVFLVSKVLPHHASYAGTLKACEASLARLGTTHLDVYLQHWTDGSYPIGETMRAMGELVDRGLIRHVGVSNFDVDELDEAKSALGKHRLACNQVLYHLGERGIESDILPWCRKNGLALVGYSPFGSRGGFPPSGSAGGKVLEKVATRLGKSPRQVALAFLTREAPLFAIPKAEKADHVRENAGGAFALPKDAIEEIEAAFPMRPGLRFL